MRASVTLHCLLGTGLWLLGLAAALAQEPCSAQDAMPAQVKSINDRLELILDDERRILLAGVEPPGSSPAHADLVALARQRLQTLVQGHDITLKLLVTAADRWGRFPALAFATSSDASAAPVALAQSLVAEGLVRVRIGQPNPCLARLLEAETQARDSALPIWTHPDYALILAGDHEAFAGREGSVVVVEGQVHQVTASGYRTYVNFGPNRFRDFSVTILKPNVKIFDKAGLSLQSLQGQRLRVRGLLDLRFGPQIEIADPTMIERLEPGLSEHEVVK